MKYLILSYILNVQYSFQKLLNYEELGGQNLRLVYGYRIKYGRLAREKNSSPNDQVLGLEEGIGMAY
uniref:Uncharacterized protein n=1 Tax=Strongyloides venezuelensis TaxID=75913 RepID=A0A0K0G5K8_STRVS